MPEFHSAYFNRIEYRDEDVFDFPAGLPGFDEERVFLPVEIPSARPLILFQSLRNPNLCFMTLPVLAVEPAYELSVGEEDLGVIGWPPDRQPRIGPDVLCVAIVTVSENGPATVNLLAPLVVSLATRRGVQAIQADSGYSHRHELPAAEGEAEAPACS